MASEQRFPGRVMLGFQRRFDPALVYARDLVERGIIGRVHKLVSSLEDSGPLPRGYSSEGILVDMAIHNVDEVLWWTGRSPRAVTDLATRKWGGRREAALTAAAKCSRFKWIAGFGQGDACLNPAAWWILHDLLGWLRSSE